MRISQYTFETQKRSFISAFSICMTVPLRKEIACEINFSDICDSLPYKVGFAEGNLANRIPFHYVLF